MDNKDIGERIRNQRKKCGMSQQELAEAVGYTSKVAISRIEAGQINVPMDKMVKIANALNVPVSELMRLSDPTPYDKSYGRNVRTIRFEFVSVCQPHLQNACFRAFWGSVVNGIDIKLTIILPRSFPTSVRIFGQ